MRTLSLAILFATNRADAPVRSYKTKKAGGDWVVRTVTAHSSLAAGTLTAFLQPDAPLSFQLQSLPGRAAVG